ncbi:histidine phosphatase family protein [Mesobacillus zeae]|uniref:Histidine phosphatase family protein n=1 Tax=Mesobacillus zeae TaxID=1917180 RepID=A0A398B798_9BACI|nr:histidine phosphatase family protein [Mesobacillus zeae]RID83596.1 histidine phosphatase family protein [Mesobacillus zeae]
MTNLYFVRHAQSAYTPDELGRPLTEKGFADAKKVTEIFKNVEIDVVISSPYKRAIQTVEGIAHDFGKEMEIEEGFKERMLSIVPAEDFTFAITKVWEDESFAWGGGESNEAARKRGSEVTCRILEKYKGKDIVIGTHGNIMVLIMSYFDQQYDFSFWRNLEMPDVYKLTFDGRELRSVERLWGG